MELEIIGRKEVGYGSNGAVMTKKYATLTGPSEIDLGGSLKSSIDVIGGPAIAHFDFYREDPNKAGNFSAHSAVWGRTVKDSVSDSQGEWVVGSSVVERSTGLRVEARVLYDQNQRKDITIVDVYAGKSETGEDPKLDAEVVTRDIESFGFKRRGISGLVRKILS